MSKRNFSKYSGSGNDFILFDRRESWFELEVPALCDRRRGIGADGVIYLENSSSADYRMRIFNADGSEAEMCGNGIRCLGNFLKELGIPGDQFRIEVMGKIYSISLKEEGQVSLELGAPLETAWDIALEGGFVAHKLDTGVPHAVIFTRELENIDLGAVAPPIRRHPLFGPRGANVNFVTLQGDLVRIRTYERGVEGETLACGTGIAAAAAAAMKYYPITSPVTVMPKSGEPIRMEIDWEGGEIKKMTQIGPAKRIFQGSLPESAFLLNLSAEIQ